jgi:hypothetical protein
LRVARRETAPCVWQRFARDFFLYKNAKGAAAIRRPRDFVRFALDGDRNGKPTVENLTNNPGDGNTGSSYFLPLESLRHIFRGQAMLHAAQIDQGIPLVPDSLLRTSWLASELASRLEARRG